MAITKASEVRVGDLVRLTDATTVRIASVQHQNFFPLQLYVLGFSAINGIDSVTLPSDTQLERIGHRPAARSRKYRVEGTAHFATGFNLVVEATSERFARDVAETKLTELYETSGAGFDGVDLQELCIQSCDPVEEAA